LHNLTDWHWILFSDLVNRPYKVHIFVCMFIRMCALQHYQPWKIAFVERNARNTYQLRSTTPYNLARRAENDIAFPSWDVSYFYSAMIDKTIRGHEVSWNDVFALNYLFLHIAEKVILLTFADGNVIVKIGQRWRCNWLMVLNVYSVICSIPNRWHSLMVEYVALTEEID